MRNQGKSYSVIGRSLNIFKQSDMNLCKYDIKINKKKCGPKQNITGFRAYIIGQRYAI